MITTDGGGTTAAIRPRFGGGYGGAILGMAWSERNGHDEVRNCYKCVYWIFVDVMDVEK